MTAAQFLRGLVAAVACRLHTVLTDNGVQLIDRSRDIHAFEQIFDCVWQEYEIEHRLTKAKHPRAARIRERSGGTVFRAAARSSG